MDGYNDRLADYDDLNYIQGAYIATGVGAPDKYPDQPLLRQGEEQAAGLTNEQLALRFGV